MFDQRTPTSFDLRVFAALQAPFVPVIAWLLAGRPTLVAAWLVGLTYVAFLVGILGLVVPRAVVEYRRVWMALLSPIQWIVSRALLAVVLYGVVTPLGLVLRAVGKRPGQPAGWLTHTRGPLREHLWRLW